MALLALPLRLWPFGRSSAAPRAAGPSRPLRPDLVVPGAIAEAVLRRRREEERLLLEERVRAGTVVVIVVAALAAVAVDPFVHSSVLRQLYASKAVLVVAAVWLLRFTHRGSTTAVVRAATATTILAVAVTSFSAIVTGERWSAAFFGVLLAVGTGGLVPWGPGRRSSPRRASRRSQFFRSSSGATASAR
jgi:hypothetical protein